MAWCLSCSLVKNFRGDRRVPKFKKIKKELGELELNGKKHEVIELCAIINFIFASIIIILMGFIYFGTKFVNYYYNPSDDAYFKCR